MLDLLKKTLAKIVSGYNSLINEEIKKVKDFSEFVPEIREQKLKLWRAEKVKPLLNENERLLKDIDSSIKTEAIKSPKIKFPLSQSVLDNEKLLSEMKRARAYNFYNTIKNYSLIKDEIELAFVTEDLDYFNSLIFIYDANRPSQIDLSKASKEVRDFYQFIDKRKQEFDIKYQITASNSLVNELKYLRAKADFVNMAIADNDKMILFPEEFEEIPERERANFVDHVNKSFGFLAAKDQLKKSR